MLTFKAISATALIFFWIISLSSKLSYGFVSSFARRGFPAPGKSKSAVHVASSDQDKSLTQSRRDLFRNTCARSLLFLLVSTPPASAEDGNTAKVLYITGKPPQVPGQKPKDKNDVTGTRKDPNFLRSLSDCKSMCENANGAIKTKEECLSECQDICCTTYEQCTFGIVPRI